ncbi:MAG: hypothetical protein KGQ65_02910 [Burkholderiales bacterium]|nr:hypothetical protein [Burkholderiales bacterium]
MPSKLLPATTATPVAKATPPAVLMPDSADNTCAPKATGSDKGKAGMPGVHITEDSPTMSPAGDWADTTP